MEIRLARVCNLCRTAEKTNTMNSRLPAPTQFNESAVQCSAVAFVMKCQPVHSFSWPEPLIKLDRRDGPRKKGPIQAPSLSGNFSSPSGPNVKLTRWVDPDPTRLNPFFSDFSGSGYFEFRVEKSCS